MNNSPRNGTSPQGRRGSTINNLLNSMGIRPGSGTASMPASASSTAAQSNGPPATGTSSTNDIMNSHPLDMLSSDDDEDHHMGRDDAGASGAVNMLGTTPFDQLQLNSTAPGLATSFADELPITLTLGAGDNAGLGQAPSNTSETQLAMKSVRHFVYGSTHPESAFELLNLEPPRNGPFPDPVDEEGIRSRKDKNGLFSLRLTPYLDQSAATNPGLYFEPIVRTAGPCSQLVIGRYTERVRESISRIPEQFHPVVFKSKVVSRTHGCFKVDSQGNWYIRDVKSSSGTFLNHHRLAPASTMSKDTLLKDGDVIQLGLDFRGGTEEIYRSVKMRIELNKSWKRRAMRFNREALQRLKELQKMTTGLDTEDCSICLSKIKPCQAIFISPCSHSWHYQCVRRLVMTTYPQFVCPNCRSSCDLEASLDSDFDSDDNEYDDMVDDEVKDMEMP